MAEETAVPLFHHLQRWLRHVIVVTYLLGFLAMLVGIGFLLITGNRPAGRDVISYWAAGRLITAHANPYDAAAVLRLERAAGFSASARALIMRNPPYALPLVLPLGAFQLRGASLVWSLLLLASLALSVHFFWVACGRPANKVHLLGYTFVPALACVMTGQSALFALLGLTLFLWLNREHSFAAGLSLWLCALKPHLFLPFGVVVLLWAVSTRRYRLIAGAALALAASSAFAAWLDPAVWTHYSQMMHSPNLQKEFVPCLSYALRAIHHQAAWLQYIPAIAGCCWAIWFYWRRRETWNWVEDGALLMLVSLVVSPYSWVTDHAVLVPALLAGVRRATTKTQLAALVLASLLIEAAQFRGVSMHSAMFVLLSAYWLGWYLYVTRRSESYSDRTGEAAPSVLAEALASHSL